MTDRPSDEVVSRETRGLTLSAEQRRALGQYWWILAEHGTERGLIGPREVDRLWARHILNCAVVALDPMDLIPQGSSVIDVGSGAGLPGLVWAIVRPDLQIQLVESLLRRANFLEEFLEPLGVQHRVQVTRARAEDLRGQARADVTTARAVAPLDRLLPWLSPLTKAGGRTLALKGESAVSELRENRPVVKKTGYTSAEVVEVGEGIVNPPTTVIRFQKGTA